MARSIPVIPAEQQIAEVEAALRALRSAQPFRGQMDLIRDVEAHLERLYRHHGQGKNRDRGPRQSIRPEADA